MATTLTVITENTVPGKSDGLCAEHGFALFLERVGERVIPLDTPICRWQRAPRTPDLVISREPRRVSSFVACFDRGLKGGLIATR